MRYSRQSPILGEGGQERLEKSEVTIVGAGALGTVAAELLCRAGVGKINIVDDDIIDLSNLQRQALYTEEDVNKPKADTLKSHLSRINSEVKVEAHAVKLDDDNLQLLDSDLVLDCTDSIETRQLMNKYLVRKGIKWIYCAASRAKGSLFVIDGTPCFNCLFPHVKQGATCESGILNANSHLMASLQAKEAIRILSGRGHEKSLLMVDTMDNRIEKITVKRDSDCGVCDED